MRRWAAPIQWPLVAGLAYFVAAEAAFAVGTLSDRIFAPFWPPNVVLFCALLLVPSRQWWIFIAAAFPAHVLAELQVGMGPAQLIVAFATNCLIAVLNALTTRYLLISPPGLATFQHAILYVVSTACINPAIAALGGALVRILGDGALGDYWTFWAQWFVANALGQLTLGPIALAFVARVSGAHDWTTRRAPAEAVLLVSGLAAACIIAFTASVDSAFLLALLYAPLPFVIWAAVRFGMAGASGAILVVTVLSVGAALRDQTLFSGTDPESNALALQLFLMGLSVPVLLLGASVEGMRRAERKSGDLARGALALLDAERRRTALELQDGACQRLAAASLLASRLNEMTPTRRASAIGELEGNLRTSIGELRAAAQVLHPPLLEEAGLEAALRSFVQGFVQRTGIQIVLDIASGLGRMPQDIEVALFRLVQEALANVSQHSRSTFAKISASVSETGEERTIALTVEDNGSGSLGWRHMPGVLRKILPTIMDDAIGLESARERLNRVGGRLEIESKPGATTVSAIVSFSQARAVNC
ncbi:MAG: MASE1 domain-containing protein [Bacteroidota bacterium]